MSKDKEIITADDVGELSSELIPASPEDVKNLLASSQSKYATTTALSEVTKVGDWLPYVQLMSGNSIQVKKGEFPMGHFALCKNRQLLDLGASFVCYLLAWRPKAMQFSPKVLSFFDTESKEFKDIQERSKGKNAGCGYGPEFLVWLPEYKELATYLLGNKTGRNESPQLIALIEDGTFKCKQEAHLIEDGEYAWHGPKTLPYDLDIELPPMSLLAKELQKFNNPPAAQEEVAEDAEDGDQGRR